MVTMVDELYDRDYQASRKALNRSLVDSVGKLAHAIGNAFEVLVKIEYQAPWAANAKRVR